MTIGEKIRFVLSMKRMEQKDLAKMTGITEVSISRYISDKRIPNALALKKICTILGVSADWMLEDVGGKNENN